MSIDQGLVAILQTMQIYSDCAISQSFSEKDSEILSVCYSKERHSFIISHHDSEETSHDIPSTLALLESYCKERNI
ncbi:hypothetical protein [Rossellomorea aquimaris]|uniref:hypothetical protein n=1 Tax=Rossellomorea aquimaris TaxID=189382 RepID=UPI001CFC974D|nr:hypothetical protein [Rossellomorea aquimaris]